MTDDPVNRSGLPDAPAPFPSLVDQPVAREWITVQRISSGISSAVLGCILVMAAGIGFLARDKFEIGFRIGLLATAFALLLILALLVVRLPVLHHRHLRWDLDSHGLAIRRGILWRSDINVPRSRIQHSDVTQGPLERSFGIATLVVFTAGTAFARVALEGLPQDQARQIRSLLASRNDQDGV